MQIFEDADCSKELDRVLYEGKTYYVNFPTSNEIEIKAAIAYAGIKDFISWNKRNKISILKVVNRVGIFRIFGKEYDIRSEKFLESETGQRQVQIILDDLATLSRHILFDNHSSLSAYRNDGNPSYHASLIERFNYYRQTCFKKGSRLGIKELIEQILKNPHSKLIDTHIKDYIWNVKNPSRQSLTSLFRNDQTFAKLNSTHPLALNRPGLKIKGSNEFLFPLKSKRFKGQISFDTPENRFIKHILLEIENTCRLIIKDNLLSGHLIIECEQLLNLCRSLLKLNFFQGIGKLSSIPYSSPTLGNKYGYREIYRIFIRSKIAARHLFNDFINDSLLVELKDIALLYEYWVFYKISNILLGSKLYFLSQGALVKDGRIVNSGTLTNGVWTVYFNKTYVRGPKGSYSLRLRPDIVIERVCPSTVNPSIFIFDAKYKNNPKSVSDNFDDNDLLLAPANTVKTEDIHKMHCYIDAIDNVKIAVAVYPGSKFIFYPKERNSSVATQPNQVSLPCGVGAIPLVPGIENNELIKFIDLIKTTSI